MTLSVIAAAVIGYLLGSIPFGLVLARLGGHGDIRRIGSGNIGATNVLRTGSKALAGLTLVLDIGKGAVAVALGMAWGEEAALASAVAVVLGHMFPLWLGFSGGKGLATAFGVLIMLSWPVAAAAGAIWLATALLTQYSSLAALLGAAAGAVLAGLFTDRADAVVIAGIAVLVIARHHANIRRLIEGRESRISFRKG